MASPVADSYSVGSGLPVWAGRYPSGLLYGGATLGDVAAAGGMQTLVSELSGDAALGGVSASGSVDGLFVPSWVTAQTVGTWGEIPFSNTLSSLDPKNNAAINPDHPASPEWYGGGFSNIVVAWCGACYDEDTDTWWLPLQGGHADYGGNEPYKALIAQEAPAWVMVRPPSGAIGNLLTTNDGQEASGVYADGQPRAIHSYNKPVFVPGVGPCLAVLGNTWYSGAAGPAKFTSIDPDTGLGTLLALNTSPANSSSSGSCYDSSRHAVWYRGEGTGVFARYDIAANTWTAVGTSSPSFTGQVSLCYLPDDDCILWGCNGIGQKFAVLDCATGTVHQPTFSGSLSGGLLPGHTQWRWVPSMGACIGWGNSSSTTLISRVTPGANPRTDAWTIDALTVDGANAVTPSAAVAQGTFGRFAYSSRLNIAMVFNSVSGSHYFFKVA